jgi:hypothetical protein
MQAGNYYDSILLNLKEDSVRKSPHAGAPPTSMDDRKLPGVL